MRADGEAITHFFSGQLQLLQLDVPSRIRFIWHFALGQTGHRLAYEARWFHLVRLPDNGVAVYSFAQA